MSNNILRKIILYLVLTVNVFFIFTISGVIVYKFFPVPFTPLMYERILENIISSKKVRIIHQWVPINQISPNMIQAAIAAEDNNFANHFGIDYKAIHEAYEYNKRGKKIRGASTITQQTSKNVFLWLNRNYMRKGFELYYTILIEIVWKKQRIMEVYLNSIEMGDGIYGIEAASRTYFHKPASKLTRGEAALIAATFPDPRRRNPAHPGKYLLSRQHTILSLMK